MKFASTRPFADPDIAARKLVEIASAARLPTSSIFPMLRRPRLLTHDVRSPGKADIQPQGRDFRF